MAPEQEPANPSVKKTLRHYAETTTVKGVPKVLKSQKLPLKVLWLTAVIFGGGMAAYQLANLLINYFNYPSTTKVTEVNEAPQFVDVTLCNLNPLTDNLTGSVTPDDFSKGLMDFSLSLMNGPGDEYDYFKSQHPDVKPTNEEIDDISATVFSPSGFFQSLPSEGLNVNPYKFMESTFRDCVFYAWDMSVLDLKCNNETVKFFFFPDHFLCYTISVPSEYKYRIKGVSAILYLEQETHATFPMFKLNLRRHKSNGMKVVIHPRHTLPSLENGDSIPPGQETTVRLSPISVELLSQPYGECIEKTYLEYDNDHPFDEERGHGGHPYLYTSESCKAICYQNHVMKECGCIDLLHSYTENQVNKDTNLPFCGNTTFIKMDVDGGLSLEFNEERLSHSFSTLLCAIRARKSAESLACSCEKSCRYYHYPRSFSQTPWPGLDHQIGFYQKYIYGTEANVHFAEYEELHDLYYYTLPDADFLAEHLSRLDKMERNFLQLNVLMADEHYQSIAEKPVFTWDTILANMGGAFNLWIGISFITVIELTELLYNMMSAATSKEQSEEQPPCHTPRKNNKINSLHY